MCKIQRIYSICYVSYYVRYIRYIYILYILLVLFTYKWYIYILLVSFLQRTLTDIMIVVSRLHIIWLLSSPPGTPSIPLFLTLAFSSSFSYPESFQFILSLPSTGCSLCLDHSPFISRLLFIHASALSSNVLTQETFPHLPMSNPLSISFQRTSHFSFVSGHIAISDFLAISAPHRHCLILLIFFFFCNYIFQHNAWDIKGSQ